MPKMPTPEAVEFSDMLEASDWSIEYDADQTTTGTIIDCSRVLINVPIRAFEQFAEALGVDVQKLKEWKDAQ